MKPRLRKQPPNVSRFEDVLLKLLTAEFGHLRPRPVRGAPLEFRIKSGTINFSNLKKRADLGDITGVRLKNEICRWVRVHVAAVGALKKSISFHKISDRLRPQLVPYGHGGAVALKCGAFGYDLETAVTVDDQHTFRYVTTADAKAWSKTKTELLARAVINLERIAKKERIRCSDNEPFGRSCLLDVLDGYASARILLEVTCHRLAEKLGLPFFFAMPARDLLVCWSPKGTQESQMKACQTILGMYRGYDHPLSPITYIMKPGFSFEVHARPILKDQQS